jgi:hypothetical protein
MLGGSRLSSRLIERLAATASVQDRRDRLTVSFLERLPSRTASAFPCADSRSCSFRRTGPGLDQPARCLLGGLAKPPAGRAAHRPPVGGLADRGLAADELYPDLVLTQRVKNRLARRPDDCCTARIGHDQTSFLTQQPKRMFRGSTQIRIANPGAERTSIQSPQIAVEEAHVPKG